MSYKIILDIIFWIIIGYLLGSVSFGYIIGKDKGVDIRDSGSGNIGTTNAIRTLGVKAGALTFLGDLLKAVIPVLLSGIISTHLLDVDSDMAYIISLITWVFLLHSVIISLYGCILKAARELQLLPELRWL